MLFHVGLNGWKSFHDTGEVHRVAKIVAKYVLKYKRGFGHRTMDNIYRR